MVSNLEDGLFLKSWKAKITEQQSGRHGTPSASAPSIAALTVAVAVAVVIAVGMRDEERRLIEILLPRSQRNSHAVSRPPPQQSSIVAVAVAVVVVSGIFAGKCMLDFLFSLSTTRAVS